MKPATPEQQKYLDHAFRYAERAMKCSDNEQWPEAATNFGSALESLLRVRFGPGDTLFALIAKFDKDPLFDSILMHEGESIQCATCAADEIRKLRNAVHPDCWKEATKEHVDQAVLVTMALYHVLVKCGGSRIAAFRTPPESILDMMEAGRLHSDPVGKHEHSET